MLVVCVDNKNLENLLTIGKSYKVDDIYNNVKRDRVYYSMMTDKKGIATGFDSSRFKLLSEVRKNKLNKCK